MGVFAGGVILVLSLVRHIYGDQFFQREETENSSCDLYKGSWVYDESYRAYDTSECPFIEKEFDCLMNGRPDKEYLKYRWQPSGCNFPRYWLILLSDDMKCAKDLVMGTSFAFVSMVTAMLTTIMMLFFLFCVCVYVRHSWCDKVGHGNCWFLWLLTYLWLLVTLLHVKETTLCKWKQRNGQIS